MIDYELRQLAGLAGCCELRQMAELVLWNQLMFKYERQLVVKLVLDMILSNQILKHMRYCITDTAAH